MARFHNSRGRRPDQHGRCVQLLTEALAGYQEQSTLLNGFIVYYLVKLGATEAAEMISQAFAAGKVEEDINGSWAAVQVALGLAKESDFTPDELLGAGDRALKEQRQVESAETAQLSGSYSILDHLRR